MHFINHSFFLHDSPQRRLFKHCRLAQIISLSLWLEAAASALEQAVYISHLHKHRLHLGVELNRHLAVLPSYSCAMQRLENRNNSIKHVSTFYTSSGLVKKSLMQTYWENNLKKDL